MKLPHLLLLAGMLLLTVAPLRAQSAPIGPRPSVLFERAADAPAPDSTSVDHGIPRQGGAMLGLLIGGGLGYFLSGFGGSGGTTACLAGDGCSGDTRSNRVVPALVGALAGVVIGDLMAEH